MHRRLVPLLPAFLLAFVSVQGAENWPEFRGPTGQGLYSGKSLATEWSTTKNVVWKQPIPGHGWSSPIVQDRKIYLTTALALAIKEKRETPETKESKKTKEGQDFSLAALCLDANTGKILWQTEVFREIAAKSPRIHGKNSHASPTPITDGKHLYVHFGHEGTACLDLKGNVVWRNTDLRYSPVHGNGGSPILVDDRLIFSADGGDKQFVVALNKADGKVIWKTDRKSVAPKKFSFSTPLLIEANGSRQIISPASNLVAAYDPADGKEIWRARYEGYSLIPRPVFGHGMVYLSSSYDSPTFLAIRVDGTGDVTDSHVAWVTKKGAPHTPSPLLVGNEIYMVSDSGIASCLDARSGKLHWKEQIGGNYSASPFYAAGKIYLQSEQGVTTVVRAGTTFEQLAKNSLNERTLASYAVADGALYLRTETLLYRIEPEGKTAANNESAAKKK